MNIKDINEFFSMDVVINDKRQLIKLKMILN
jgi:hypothetical protein